MNLESIIYIVRNVGRLVGWLLMIAVNIIIGFAIAQLLIPLFT